MKFQPGDEITALYVRSGVRHILLLKVVKVGRKYLYGMTLYFEPDGQIREGHEVKITIAESTIYPGLRQDLRAAEMKYRVDYRSWQHQRNEKEAEIAYELTKILRSRIDAWKEENPIPELPKLPPSEDDA